MFVESAANREELAFSQFLEINYDDNIPIFEEFDVSGFPQLLVFKNGVEQTRIKGKGHTKQEIVDLVSPYK